jgi:hypothetical protein
VTESSEFFEQACASETDECLLWPFAVSSDGIPTMRPGGPRSVHVRQLVATATAGAPDDAIVEQVCGAQLCVNPSHLHWHEAPRSEHRRWLRSQIFDQVSCCMVGCGCAVAWVPIAATLTGASAYLVLT